MHVGMEYARNNEKNKKKKSTRCYLPIPWEKLGGPSNDPVTGGDWGVGFTDEGYSIFAFA